MSQKLETAIFGGGCFWCTEAVFSELKGVTNVTSGYAGGAVPNPSYEEVCSGTTGHAEVIKIDFDPDIITYRQLVDIFLHTHNPTTPNRQGADIGSQYRSIILTITPEQSVEVHKAIVAYNNEKVFDSSPVVTEVKPLEAFYPAEDYHRLYFQRNQEAPYCQLVINPKLAKFRQQYASLRKTKEPESQQPSS